MKSIDNEFNYLYNSPINVNSNKEDIIEENKVLYYYFPNSEKLNRKINIDNITPNKINKNPKMNYSPNVSLIPDNNIIINKDKNVKNTFIFQNNNNEKLNKSKNLIDKFNENKIQKIKNQNNKNYYFSEIVKNESSLPAVGQHQLPTDKMTHKDDKMNTKKDADQIPESRNLHFSN